MVTGNNGAYVITPVPVGFYDVAIELSGFRRFNLSRLKIDATTRATVDARLDVGEMTDSVTVQASTVMLQGETGQIGRMIEGRQVVDLTLAGRNPIVLPLMKAGVVGSNFSAFNPTSLDGAALSISGGQRAGNNITFDGVPAVRTRIETSGAMIGQLNPDAIEEVQILTSTYRAEYGRAMDGQVRFVTKGGAQNFAARARTSSATRRWTPIPGCVIAAPTRARTAVPLPSRSASPVTRSAGPIVLPGKFNTDRSRLFFFGSQEWTRWRRDETNTQTVPSAAMRQGNFSELLDPTNPFFRRSAADHRSAHGAAVPGQRHPAEPAEPERAGAAEHVSAADPRLPARYGQPDSDGAEPAGQPQGHLSPRLQPVEQPAADVQRHELHLQGGRAFRAGFIHSATRWDRPNYTTRGSWTSVLSPRW